MVQIVGEPLAGIASAVRAIQTNPQKHFSKDELAKIAGLPLRNFKIEFKRIVGSSPYDYLLKIRARAAAALIAAEPSADLRDIANRVGFPNVGTLTRKFRREYGIAIDEFRQKNTTGL
jgi:AraC family transcriptional regulator, arabinose operon regulatory protein